MFDIHGILRSKISDATHLLFGATFGIRTANRNLVFSMDKVGATAGTSFWHLPGFRIMRPAPFIDLNNFGNHISTFFYGGPISDSNIFALYLLLVMQSRPRNCTP